MRGVKKALGLKFTWVITLFAFSLLLGFQNCSFQGFESSSTSPTASLSSFSLDSLTLATVNNPLQNSCLCIDCSKAEIQALSGAQCSHIRWGRFPWNPWEQGGEINQVFNTSVKQPLIESVNAAKETFGANVSFEFGIPEFFHNNYRQLNVSQSEMQIINNYLSRFIPEHTYPLGNQTPFSQMPTKANPAFTIPILDQAIGLQWHFYLGKLAIDSGATSIYFSQVNHRLTGGQGTSEFVKLIKALRAYGYEVKNTSLIIGAESLFDLPEPYPGAFVEQIQYIKFITDTDVAQLKGDGRWVVLRKDGSELDCLGQENLDPSKPSARNQNGQLIGQICIAKSDTNGELREFNTLGHRGPSFMAANPHKIPVLLELDGCQDCDWINGVSLTHPSAKGAGNTVFYKSHGDESLTTCHSRVRNGLSTTMQFLSQPKWVREAFINYMVKTAIDMTQATGVPTYFPRPVKVDQNHYWQLAGGTLSRAAQQKALVRQCPLTDDGPSQNSLPIGLHYMAGPCGDLGAVKDSLSSDFLDRFLKRSKDQPPLFSIEQLRQLYVDILKREMEDGDYEIWLRTGKTLTQIKNDLQYFCTNKINGECGQQAKVPSDSTPTPKVNYEQVAQAYVQILKRSGSPNEISYWVSSGKSLSEIQADLNHICQKKINGECSPQAPTAPPAASVTYSQVSQLYMQILKRPGSSSEISYWMNSGKTLAQIQTDLNYFCQNKINGECSQVAPSPPPPTPSTPVSSSGVTYQQVSLQYVQILKRAGSNEEIMYWINSGKTLAQIQADLNYFCTNKINGECR